MFSMACQGAHSKMQVFPKDDSVKQSKQRSNSGEGDKMAKLLRERSTAQKRRQCKRDELATLQGIMQGLENKLAKLRTRVDALAEPERSQVLAAQARAGTPPLGCRLCSILDRNEDFSNLDRLVHHFRVHHASDLRQRGDDFELETYAREIPSEDSIELSDNEDANDSDEDMTEVLSKTSSVDSIQEMKRKLRLKRNAASARKSRKRKRVQLERWRMTLPMLRFQVETTEAALRSVCYVRSHHQVDAEPDVISAAFALIKCSVSTPRPTM